MKLLKIFSDKIDWFNQSHLKTSVLFHFQDDTRLFLRFFFRKKISSLENVCFFFKFSNRSFLFENSFNKKQTLVFINVISKKIFLKSINTHEKIFRRKP